MNILLIFFKDDENKHFETSFWKGLNWSNIFPNYLIYLQSFENNNKDIIELKWSDEPIDIVKNSSRKKSITLSYIATIMIRRTIYQTNQHGQQGVYYFVEIERIRTQNSSDYTSKNKNQCGNSFKSIFSFDAQVSYQQEPTFNKDNLENIEEEEEGPDIYNSKIQQYNVNLNQESNKHYEFCSVIQSQEQTKKINTPEKVKMNEFNDDITILSDNRRYKNSFRLSINNFDLNEKNSQRYESLQSPDYESTTPYKDKKTFFGYQQPFSPSKTSLLENNQSTVSLTNLNELKGLEDASTNFSPTKIFNKKGPQNSLLNSTYKFNSMSFNSNINLNPEDTIIIPSGINSFQMKSFQSMEDKNFLGIINRSQNNNSQHDLSQEREKEENDEIEHQIKLEKFKNKLKTIQSGNISRKELNLEKCLNNINSCQTSTNFKSKYVYFSQYKSIHEFVASQSIPRSLKILISIKTIETILYVISSIILSYFIKKSIVDLQQKLSLMQLQSKFLSPLDEGFGIFQKQLDLVDILYFAEIDNMPIQDLQNHKKYFDFLNRNMNHTLYRMRDFFDTMDYQSQEFIDFLSQVHEFKEKDNLHHKLANLTIRNAITLYTRGFIYLNQVNWTQVIQNFAFNGYKYEFQFSQMNMINMTSYFSQLSGNLIDVLKKEANDGLKEVQIFLAITGSLFTILMAMSFIYYIRFQHIKRNIFNLFQCIDSIWLNLELEKNKNNLQQLKLMEEIEPFSNFSFNLFHYDEQLFNAEKQKEKLKSKSKLKTGTQATRIEIPQHSFYSIKILIAVFLLFIGILIGSQISISVTNENFVNNYIQNAQTFSYFSDSSSLVTRLAGYRILIKKIRAHLYDYYIQSDIKDIVQEFDERINQMRIFINDQLLIQVLQSSSDHQIPEFTKFIKAANSHDICNKIYHFTDIQLQLCENANDGILKQGLTSSLTKLINDIKSEKEQTKDFSMEQKVIPEYFISSLLCSRILSFASDLLLDGIQNICDYSWKWILVVIIIFGLFAISVNIIQLVYSQTKLTEQYHLQKQSLFLLPLQTLNIERKFFTSLRIIYLSYQLYSNQIQK